MKKLRVLILVILVIVLIVAPSIAEKSLVKICVNGIF